MASPVLPLPTVKAASQSRGIQKSPKPSRRDKVRQGKLIRCWTDEEESFLFQSRTQGQKLSYKNIAHRLDKSELACRLHYHHMTVGRKGHGQRTEDFDDDNISENSDASSLSRVPSASETPVDKGLDDAKGQKDPSNGDSLSQHKLPNFQTFLQHTFHHQRSTSMPGPLGESEIRSVSRELHLHNGTRPIRTMSGTWIKEHRRPETRPPTGTHYYTGASHTSQSTAIPTSTPLTHLTKTGANGRPYPSPFGGRY
ncbi:hypothetical protein G647_09891 [Cladophialophora carrionii CBS 160.54]|uniref:Myb-like domain-containing protein n=1 Tax=Cladophialophora carrionii CBS 160.54 TaxID=1279043 RepID=V9DLJ4_9EURO|nr:uncharacterized protein G647_09891 [Cladophialophora carrionii CBS 160.54]ETI27208.1 hypothetical protein G647_09891 [Cladophialophora carrionii CBS 160.54]